jgi:hypothetical protein
MNQGDTPGLSLLLTWYPRSCEIGSGFIIHSSTLEFREISLNSSLNNATSCGMFPLSCCFSFSLLAQLFDSEF